MTNNGEAPSLGRTQCALDEQASCALVVTLRRSDGLPARA